MAELFYTDGTVVRKLDKVVVHPSRHARVKLLLEPGSELAHAYSCPEGGLVLEFEDGDCQVWSQPDEDITFIQRGG